MSTPTLRRNSYRGGRHGTPGAVDLSKSEPPGTRRGLRQRRSKTKNQPTRARVEPLVTGVKRSSVLDGFGWYEPASEPVPSTTRQTEALRLAVARTSGTEEALIEGIDLETGGIVYSDPGSDYLMADGTRATTRVRLGGLGEGKTTGMKTGGIMRPLILGRRSMVIDKKVHPKLRNAGEYTNVARALGCEPLRFSTDGSGVRINALDPQIAMVGTDQTGAGQTALMRAILHEAMGKPVTELQGKALRVALITATQAAREQGRVPDIRDMVPALYRPAATDYVSKDELRAWGLEPAAALERCVEEDLVGLVDGPTDPRLTLAARLTSFDISGLPSTGPALGVVMAIIATWTAAVLRRRADGQLVHSLTDEAWWLTRDSFGSVAKQNIKVSRAIGLINEFAFHHLSDIDRDSPAMSIIKEAGTVMIYKQDKDDDAKACEQEFSLPPGSAERLKNLDPGTYCLWQSGRPLRWVQHVRSDEEMVLTDSDEAFRDAARGKDLTSEPVIEAGDDA